MASLMESFKEMSPVKIAALAGTALVLLGFFAFLSTRMSSPSLSPLYSGLSMEDSAQIVEELEKASVPYEITAGGSQIMVPNDRVLRLRMGMAQEGLPSSGNIVGYEIFDRSDKLGTSSFVHNVNMLRALEGELARTIGAFSTIESARVHLVLPKRELFSRERQQPSASVVLTMRGGNELSKGEVAAIRHLVATAVPELKPTQITLVDNKGRLLAKGGDDEDDMGAYASNAAEYRTAFEKRLREIVEGLLERTVGQGKVRAEITADIDFDRIVENSETFDPEGQVARSVQTTEEKENSRERGKEENVSVANQLPDAAADEAGNVQESNRSMTDELVNYEISKVVQNHIKESGSVNRLSVAVLVDGIYKQDEEGKLAYEPRSQEELDKFTALVKSAVGFDEVRGDTIEIVNMPFSDPAGIEKAEDPLEWLKRDLQGIIQTLVIGIVAILAILLIIKPIVNRVIEVSAEAARDEEDKDADAAAQLALMGPDMAMLADQRGAGSESEEEMIDVDRVQGKIRSVAMRRVRDILENHPEEALTALRQWMDERAGAK